MNATILSKQQFNNAKCATNSVTSKESLFAVCNKQLWLEKFAPFTNIYIYSGPAACYL